MPRSTRTLDTSLTSHQPTGLDYMVCLGILKKLPMLNELHQLIAIVPGLSPQVCASASAASCNSRSCYLQSSSTVFSLSSLSRSRECLVRAV
jgi:hypothetical protein